ncbi:MULTISPECIES: hypothetical protein [unclassified Arthrobacter]|uniref:hypothetical protein n=1 Tax=unclassified Arthrobacter TaxID=235627 RepID=UPI001E3E304F|nr:MULTISPECIES: hypothetical protein [unclassified Arthrobacter]MCC9145168.1 hypothetical protein [Arthrobacter sp. zg-Y919]MDK1276396.1 hypothetical protein [Arthrobacter sp. zg.Y919]WIB02003.1 hypothetical protein QNO10_08410 [Arthrobacter sp. zg-Y919]
MPPQVIPMLPCTDIDEMSAFFSALGFQIRYRQTKPNPYVAVEGYGFPLHYYGLEGHRAEESHSTCGILVADTGSLFEAFAAGLKTAYGRLPVSGYPRITRPRPRANADGRTGFSLIDPAGNWIRIMNEGPVPQAKAESSPLGRSLDNAVVLADSKGDTAQAAKILSGAIRRADAADPGMSAARGFLAELEERML